MIDLRNDFSVLYKEDDKKINQATKRHIGTKTNSFVLFLPFCGSFDFKDDRLEDGSFFGVVVVVDHGGGAFRFQSESWTEFEGQT